VTVSKALLWALFEDDLDDLQDDLRARCLEPELFLRVYMTISRPRGGSPRFFDLKSLSKRLGISHTLLVRYLDLLNHYEDANMDRGDTMEYYGIAPRTVKALVYYRVPLIDWVRAWSAMVKFIEQVEEYHLYRDFEFRRRGQYLSIKKIKARYIKVLNKRGIPKAAYIVKVALHLVVRPTGETGADAP
jgi:hypothetical protein